MAVAAVIGLVVSAVALWPRPGPADFSVGEPVPGQRATTPVASSAPLSEGRVLTRPAVGRVAARAPRPVSVRLESIDLRSRVTPVGVTPEGLMRLPDQPWVLGWYRFGGTPGARSGSAVLAGHLDSLDYGVGPLVGLRDVEPGDPIEITLANGRHLVYKVTGLHHYDRESLPAELFATGGPPVLRIITCGGSYDADSGGYQQNLVVSAAPA